MEKINVLHSSLRQVPFILLRFLYTRYPRAWRTTIHRLHERNEREKCSKREFGRGKQMPLKPFFLHKLTITENGITIPGAHVRGTMLHPMHQVGTRLEKVGKASIFSFSLCRHS